MSLWLSLSVESDGESDMVYHRNATHNLCEMAHKAGIYEALWCSSGKLAKDVVGTVVTGLIALITRPEQYNAYAASNGWGDRNHLVEFAISFIEAASIHPNALISVSK